MAVLAMTTGMKDMERRLGAMVVAPDMDGQPVTGQASGALPNVYLTAPRRVPTEGGVKRERPAGVRPARAEGVVRKKKRLAPASRSCLACTKGKHSAHTCGVRGKEIEERLKAEALAKLASPNGHGSLPNGSPKAS